MLSMRLFFGFHDVEERVRGVRTRSCCLRHHRSHQLWLSLERVASQQSPFSVLPEISRCRRPVPRDNESGFDGLVFDIMSPVRLHEDGIHLGEIDGFGLGSDGFDEGAETEVFNGAEVQRTTLTSYWISKLTSGDFEEISTLWSFFISIGIVVS